ncbi:universal stress protein [Pseudoroseomonas globiformis]|uniref:Universal stress protein n=1 Tax=Teichococcus globiformis TaxID=2307229 RepID=A0ABV7G0R4_9PROT
MPEAARRDRVFLVMVDNSPERRVALLRVIEPEGTVEWAGVGAMLQEERRDEAEKLLSALAAEVQDITGGLPILLIREGEARDELLALLEEDPRLSILILASGVNGGGPGPLITALTGRYAPQLRVPMTIVPGNLDDAELARVT